MLTNETNMLDALEKRIGDAGDMRSLQEALVDCVNAFRNPEPFIKRVLPARAEALEKQEDARNNRNAPPETKDEKAAPETKRNPPEAPRMPAGKRSAKTK